MLSYICIPITNRNKTHTIKIDLNTNYMYYKNKEGNYILIDDLHQVAQDASHAFSESNEGNESIDSNDSFLDEDPQEIVAICQQELDLIMKNTVITQEQINRKAELELLIAEFKLKLN
jgi:hypothetical protein